MSREEDTWLDGEEAAEEYERQVARDHYPVAFVVRSSDLACPVCGMTSFNARDHAEGYCGNCHAFTRPRPEALS